MKILLKLSVFLISCFSIYYINSIFSNKKIISKFIVNDIVYVGDNKYLLVSLTYDSTTILIPFDKNINIGDTLGLIK